MYKVLTNKTNEPITYKNYNPKTKWFDSRIYMPNPNHCDTYPCIVRDSIGKRIKYIQFYPESPYDRGSWQTDDEVLWFTVLEFPHNLIDKDR